MRGYHCSSDSTSSASGKCASGVVTSFSTSALLAPSTEAEAPIAAEAEARTWSMYPIRLG